MRTLAGSMAVTLALWIAAAAAADTITVAGSPIPLRDCTIQEIKLGRVYFIGPRGRREWRELDEVTTLGFDGLPELDEAERLIAAGDSQRGVRELLGALARATRAKGELPRLWLRVRLAQMHDARGEFVQAAGHAAVVFRLRDESYWRRLAPAAATDAAPTRPGYPAAEEAVSELTQSMASVTNRDLRTVMARLIRVVEPIRRRLAASYDGPPVVPGTTLSGVSIASLVGGEAPRRPPGQAGDRAVEDRTRAPAKARRTPVRPPAVVAPGAARAETHPAGSPEAIDALLADGRWEDALAVCLRIAEDPGPRSLGRFLHQHGRALASASRPRDAAVMFMRCALLFPASPHAAPSLVATARIYRDEYRDEPVARRLLDRAIRRAETQGDDETVKDARAVLQTLGTRGGS